MDYFAKGERLLSSGDLTSAIEAFTQAIQVTPTSPEYFLQRSIALHRAKDYTQALQDSEAAVSLAYNRGKKNIRANAQFRRSIALYCLKRVHDAKYILNIAVTDGCKEKSISIWQNKMDSAVAAHPEGQPIVKEIPEVVESANMEVTSANDTTISATAAADNVKTSSKVAINDVATSSSVQARRFEWYQNAQEVIISFYFKNATKEHSRVVFGESSLSVELFIPGSNTEVVHEFDRLFSRIVPAKSSFRILGTKVEVTLHKAEDIKWTAFEAPSEATRPVTRATPVYPTSSKKGTQNWDAIGDSVEEEKIDADTGITELFQTIYKDASEDTKRAMIKSYTESSGTALSTDWKTVGKGKVEITAPEGMVSRKYES